MPRSQHSTCLRRIPPIIDICVTPIAVCAVHFLCGEDPFHKKPAYELGRKLAILKVLRSKARILQLIGWTTSLRAPCI